MSNRRLLYGGLRWLKRLVWLYVFLWLWSWVANPETRGAVFQALGLVMQIAFAIVFVLIQFVAMFWYLSRSREETILPGQAGMITLEDYWGQPQIVEVVRQWVSLLQGVKEFQQMGGQLPNGVLLVGPPGSGKSYLAKAIAGSCGLPFVSMDSSSFAQPLSARVAVPGGWKAMGDLGIGEDIIGSDGSPSPVLGIYPQGLKQIFKVGFSDGAETRVTDDHLWKVRSVRNGYGTWRILDTATIRRDIGSGKRAAIPKLAGPVQYLRRTLPLDPYVLGVLLGNGCFTSTSVVLTTSDQEILDEVRRRLPGHTVLGNTPHFRVIGLRTVIRGLGLDGKVARTKFIPDEYLVASEEQRLDLLRGLMDTDGSAVNGYARFFVLSAELMNGVRNLVWSLGGTTGRTGQHLSIRTSANPFLLPRKAVKYKASIENQTYRYITSIEPDGKEEAQCILVGAPDHLYVTDDYIVTHNTNMFMGVGAMKVIRFFKKARNLAREYGGAIVFIDEVDAIARSRGGMARQNVSPNPSHTVAHQISGFHPFIMGGGMGGGGSMELSTILYELDGNMERTRGERLLARLYGLFGAKMPARTWTVFTMAATNVPEAIDPALTRAGRLDRRMVVNPPDRAGRREIIQGYLGKIRTAEGLDVEILTDEMAGMTPAELKMAVTSEAPRKALFRGADRIGMADFRAAVNELTLGIRNPIRDIQQRDREAIAYHEAGHAVLVWVLTDNRLAHSSIVRYTGEGESLGHILPREVMERHITSLVDYWHRLIISLGGRAGEIVRFGEPQASVGGDLHNALHIASALLGQGFWGTPLTTEEEAMRQSRWLFDQALEEATRLLNEYATWHRSIAEALLKEDEIDHDFVQRLLGERPSIRVPLPKMEVRKE